MTWFTLLATPAVLRELVTGGDLIANTVYVLLFTLGMLRFRSPGWRIAAAIALGFALSTRANFVFILPLVFACLAHRERLRSAIGYVGLTTATAVAVTLPFYLHDTSHFTPLLASQKVTEFNTVIPHAKAFLLGGAAPPDAVSGLLEDGSAHAAGVPEQRPRAGLHTRRGRCALDDPRRSARFQLPRDGLRALHRLRRRLRDLGRLPNRLRKEAPVSLPSSCARRPDVFPLEWSFPLSVGATVFAFACGSSSVHVVRQIGQPVRWLSLLALLVLAAAWVWDRREGLLLPRAVVIATAAFLAVALTSALWSVAPRVSAERAISLGILFAAALLLAQACAGRPRDVERVLIGVLGGAAVVAVAGIVVFVVAHHSAVQAATTDIAERYQGLGENPDTAALLYAVTLPISVWLLLVSRRRALAGSVVLLLFGSIVASDSRGALIAAGIGAVVLVAAWGGRSRRTAVALAAIVAAFAAGAVIGSLPSPASSNPAASAPVVKAPAARPPYLNVEAEYPLDADVGRPLPGNGEPWKPRAIFGGSGRSVAWTGAIYQVAGRPLLGYGFGTESRVFVDRYFSFVGGLTENSYIGLALELGTVGLVLLLVLVVLLIVAGWPALAGPNRSLVAACLGAVAAGLAIGVTQSYFYSVGNIASAALWITAFLLPAVAVRRV